MKKIAIFIKSFIPFEIKKPYSIISLLLAVIVLGFITKFGEWLFDQLVKLVSPIAPEILSLLQTIFTYQVEVNLITLIIFLILFIPLYRYFEKRILQRLGETIIFEDDFDAGNKGWNINYWGSHRPEKTCRFEKSVIVFEANEAELADSRKEYGAYYDLTSGIYEGDKYEISCFVRSDKNSTMGFKLWVHDIKGENDTKFPARFYTPGENFEEIKVGFIGTTSLGLRIHLHNKAGEGKIMVDKVRVVKVKQTRN